MAAAHGPGDTRMVAAVMTMHTWWRHPHNPRVLLSEPPRWEIWKLEQFHYALHDMDCTDSVAPFAVHRDWQALAELADKKSPED